MQTVYDQKAFSMFSVKKNLFALTVPEYHPTNRAEKLLALELLLCGVAAFGLAALVIYALGL